jgi:type VI protein secretion system component VasK
LTLFGTHWLFTDGSQGISFELQARPAPQVVETQLTIDGQKLHTKQTRACVDRGPGQHGPRLVSISRPAEGLPVGHNQLSQLSDILFTDGSQGISFELQARPAPQVVETQPAVPDVPAVRS